MTRDQRTEVTLWTTGGGIARRWFTKRYWWLGQTPNDSAGLELWLENDEHVIVLPGMFSLILHDRPS